MEKFMTPERTWPTGWTRLHVYLLPEPGDEHLARLVDNCRQVLADFPFITPVPDPWLHATVQMIGGPAADVTPAQRTQLVDRLTTALADLPPTQLTVGSPLAGASGVAADMDGDLTGEPFHQIYARVRTAIRDVLGPDSVDHDTMPPHLSLGYGTGTGDSGKVQTALRRRVRPSHASMTVHQVHLLNVVQDADLGQFRWTSVGRVPLGAGPSRNGRIDTLPPMPDEDPKTMTARIAAYTELIRTTAQLAALINRDKAPDTSNEMVAVQAAAEVARFYAPDTTADAITATVAAADTWHRTSQNPASTIQLKGEDANAYADNYKKMWALLRSDTGLGKGGVG